MIDEGWLALDDPMLRTASFKRMAEDAAQEERERGLRNAVVSPTSRAAAIAPGDHRELSDTDLPRRTSVRSSRRSMTIYRRFGLNDRQIEIISRGNAQARLLLPVAARQPALRPRAWGRARACLHRRVVDAPIMTAITASCWRKPMAAAAFAADWLRAIAASDWAAQMLLSLRDPSNPRRICSP